MSKKAIITEEDLRRLIREDIALAYIEREQQKLNEWLNAVLAAVPVVAKYAPKAWNAVKGLTGAAKTAKTATDIAKAGKAASDVANVANTATKAAQAGQQLSLFGNAAQTAGNVANVAQKAGQATQAVQTGTNVAQTAGKLGTLGTIAATAGSFMDKAQPYLDKGQDLQYQVDRYKHMSGQARGIAKGIFGNKKNTQQIQQAVGTMGPDVGRLGDQGIQSIFGKNNPQQMLDMSVAINQGGLGDAALLYGAMKGMGTDEKVVKDVIARRSSDLRSLSTEFASFITQHPDEKDTDLISWLRGDGMKGEAKLVAMATGVQKKGGLLGNFMAK